MKNEHKNILIIGGGQASAYASQEIRKHDSESTVTIVTEEKFLPYERPPLSKNCLVDKRKYEDCLFFPEKFYDENNIEVKKNIHINNIDFNKKIITGNSNCKLSYDKLLIATGSKNRELEFENNDLKNEENILYLRNIDDSKKINLKIKECNNPVIIGCGFIGLEIAASISQFEKKVTLIEKSSQLMGRVIPEEISKLVKLKHEQEGNIFFLNSNIKKIEKENKEFVITLDLNKVIKTDLIIIGVGSIPNTSVFENSELIIENGIKVNEFCQSSIEDVFAAGDVANFYHPHYGKYMRLESYKHAQNHGIFAAKNICGLKESYVDIPWMWSDQFDLNLQLSGVCDDYDDMVSRGKDIREGIIYFFLKKNIIHGACGLAIGGKVAKNIRLASKLSEKKIKMSKEILSDTSTKLNKYL